ncbi:ABC transporter substrate-binding protein [Segetibacter koreensis]|uniref:ABC transporter substrate-binding protein n=1 Tax=Segetibacter koreensis TaxID=398037 RepID=UPI00036E17A9|nr:helical backbone metal receptor [Segetibacter koreensis]
MPISPTGKLNNFKNLSFIPKRIVSLVPSQTELLFSLGLDEEVVGITKFCVHPEHWFRKKQRVGGTKTIKTDVVKSLQPDLIIASKEENVKEQIEELKQIAPVWVSDIKTLDDALEMITSMGILVHQQIKANKLATEIKEAFEQIIPIKEKTKTAYLIWKDPYIAAGADTFIHDMLSCCGLTNTFAGINRYPEITISEVLPIQPSSKINTSNSVNRQEPSVTNDLSSQNCDLVLLSSEPYPFKQKHLTELQTILPATKIMLVDGEMFSWYGSRLLQSAQYFKNLIQRIQG